MNHSAPRSVPAAGLWPCLLLALLLHGLLLFSLGQPTPTHSQAGATRQVTLQVMQVMQVMQIVQGPATQLTPAAKVQPPVAAAARPADPGVSPATSPPAQTKPQAEGRWTAVADGDISIDYPDAPLPGGRLLLRVMVQLDAQGHMASLQSANEADSEAEKQVQAAFVEAVATGLATTDFPLIRLSAQPQQLQASTLCLEVLFEERNPIVRLSWLSTTETTPPPCQPRRRMGQS